MESDWGETYVQLVKPKQTAAPHHFPLVPLLPQGANWVSFFRRIYQGLLISEDPLKSYCSITAAIFFFPSMNLVPVSHARHALWLVHSRIEAPTSLGISLQPYCLTVGEH